jgi:hypothetical protein
MTFGYNASTAFGNTTATIIDHAKDLLTCLVDKREEEGDIRLTLAYPGNKQADHIRGSFSGWHCHQTGWCSDSYKGR